MLRRRLSLGVDETPQSLASRMARRHGVSAYTFCAELGLSFRKLVHGRPEAIAGLGALADVSPEALSRNAFVDDDRFLYHRGQTLLASQVRRYRMRFCPLCLRDDVAAGDMWHGGEASVAGRTTWLVEQIRTCPVHSVALITLTAGAKRDEIHDVAGRLAHLLPDLDRLTSEAAVRPASPFETYLVDRLDGRRGPAWLDGLSLHVVLNVCAGLGMAATCREGAGPGGWTDDQWYLAETEGFEVAREGEEGLRAFMEHMQETYDLVRRNQPRTWGSLGKLFGYLRYHSDDEAFAPVQALIAGFIADRRPIEGKVLGVSVKRRLHSLKTAGKKVGMTPKALRLVLDAHGLLPEGHEGMSPGGVVLDADKVDGLLASLKDRWYASQVGNCLDLTMYEIKSFMQERLLFSLSSKTKGPVSRYMFDRKAVEGLLSTLYSLAEMIDEECPGYLDLAAASDATIYQRAKIIRLLFDRKLGRVRRIAGEKGLSALRFDVDELRQQISGLRGNDLTRQETMQLLGISSTCVGKLKAAGHLRLKEPEPGQPLPPFDCFLFEDVSAFAERYVSIHNHAKSLGIRQDKARDRLSAKGIEPTLGRETCSADFYLRSKVDP